MSLDVYVSGGYINTAVNHKRTEDMCGTKEAVQYKRQADGNCITVRRVNEMCILYNMACI